MSTINVQYGIDQELAAFINTYADSSMGEKLTEFLNEIAELNKQDICFKQTLGDGGMGRVILISGPFGEDGKAAEIVFKLMHYKKNHEVDQFRGNALALSFKKSFPDVAEAAPHTLITFDARKKNLQFLKSFSKTAEFDRVVAVLSTPLAQASTTLEAILDKRSLTEEEYQSYASQILTIQDAMQKQGIMNRDWKPSNLLISNGRVVVIDFDFFRQLERWEAKAMTILGTPDYMAPEIVMGKPYSLKAESYSIGMTLLVMEKRATPFAHHSLADYLKWVPKFVEEGRPIDESIKFLRTIESKKRQVIVDLMHPNPKLRKTAAKVLKYPYFQSGS